MTFNDLIKVFTAASFASAVLLLVIMFILKKEKR